MLGFNTGKVFKTWSPDKPFLPDGSLDPQYVRLATPIAHTIRFMDWLNTNDNMAYLSSLDDAWRKMLDQQVQLANACGSDFWFNVPFHASDAWTTQAVAYIRARLRPQAVILIEWSNEPWNSGLGAYKQLRRETGVDAGGGDGLKFFDAWAVYAGRAFAAARAADPGCVLVLGAHPENMWMTNKVYDRLELKPDAIAITFYAGTSSRDPLRNIQTARQLIDAAKQRWRDKGEAKMVEAFAFADAHDLDVFGYEGGQHLVAPLINGKPDPRIVPLAIEAQDDPAILELMDLPYTKFIDLGGKRAVFFMLVSLYDQWGCWGLARTIGELADSIKYRWALTKSQP